MKNLFNNRQKKVNNNDKKKMQMKGTRRYAIINLVNPW